MPPYYVLCCDITRIKRSGVIFSVDWKTQLLEDAELQQWAGSGTGELCN